MSAEHITRPGRLHDELERFGRLVERRVPLHVVWETRYPTGPDWSREFMAFKRLVVDVLAMLDCVRDAGMRGKLKGVLEAGPGALIKLEHVSNDSHEFFYRHISLPRTLDLLKLFHLLMIEQENYCSLDVAKAQEVCVDIETLLEEIRAGEESEIDAFLIDKLSELKFVLERFSLFGDEGVCDAVDQIKLKLVNASMNIMGLSDVAAQRLAKAALTTKFVSDVLLYGYTAATAIEWAGGKLLGGGTAG